jgi:hypothetical protein
MSSCSCVLVRRVQYSLDVNASAAQLRTLQRALRRAVHTEATPMEIDRLFLECGVPSEAFGIETLRETDLYERIARLCEDLGIWIAIAPE